MAAPKKPWRFCFALAFPVSAALAQDKVDEVVERTAEIERREELFLQQVLDKSRREDGEQDQLSIADAFATAIQWLCALLGTAAGVVGIALLITAAIPSMVQSDLIFAAAAVMGVIVGVSIAGWIAISVRSLGGIRVFVVLALAAFAILALVRSEITLIENSQEKLRDTLTVHDLTESEQDYIMDGGHVPTLTQRFIFDGPAWFLSHLSDACGGDATDRAFWEDDAGSLDLGLQNQTCVDKMVHDNMSAEAILQPVLAGFLAGITLQLVMASLLLIVADPNSFRHHGHNHSNSRATKSREHKRQRSGRRISTRTNMTFTDRMLSGTARLITAAAFAGTAVLITLIWNLLTTCSLEVSSVSLVSNWHLWWGIAASMATVFGIIAIRFDWRSWLGSSLVCSGLVYNAITLHKLLQILTDFGVSSTSTQTLIFDRPSRHVLHELKTWYTLASHQQCYIISHWLSHVCTSSSSSSAVEHRNQWDTACQQEFGTLLINTVVVLAQFLSVVLSLDAVLLVVLSIPTIRDYAMWAWGSCCNLNCWTTIGSQPSKPASLKTRDHVMPIVPLKLFQRSSLEFSEAQQMYLKCIRATNDAACEVEAGAFEAEWARISRRQQLHAYQATSKYRTIPSATNSSEGIMVTERDFEAIVRSLVIRRLIVKCKLDVSVSLSSDGKLLFVQVSAPDNILMARLCELDNYQLQFADAIDPGPTFWRKQHGEMEKDVKILEPHEVKQQFKVLLRESEMSKRSANPDTLLVQKSEMEWFPSETLAQASMRANALRRIWRFESGGFPPLKETSMYHVAPFVRYSPRPQLQFIYKKYPNKLDIATNSLRRSSVLRTIDCIRLTRGILDEAFDLNAMLNSNVLASVQSLHSASRMDICSREELASRWIAYWRYSSHSESLTSPATPSTSTSLHLVCNWKRLCGLLRSFARNVARWAPHRQPIQDIRDYFGESIAFFFAWSTLYLQLMTFPALVVGGSVAYSVFLEGTPPPSGMLALLREFYQPSPSESKPTPQSDFSPFDYAVGSCTVLAMILFVKVWEQQSEWYRLKWGAASNENTRTSSRPDTDEYGFVLLHSSHLVRQLLSWGTILFIVTCNAAIVLALVLLQGYTIANGWTGDVRVTVAASCLFQVALIQLIAGNGGTGGSLVSQLSTRLSEWENHRSEEAFKDSAILKQFFLQFFVAFQGVAILLLLGIEVKGHENQSSSPLLLELLMQLQFLDVIFGNGGFVRLSKLFQDYKQYVLPHADTFVQIQTLILFVFASRLASRILTVIRHAPTIARVLEYSNANLTKSHNNRRSREKFSSVEIEHELPEYNGEGKAYTDFVMQLALAATLSSVFPLTPMLTFVDAAIALRLNALELACLTRRPGPKYGSTDNGIGLWRSCIRVVVKLSAATLVALIFFRASWSAPVSKVFLVRQLGTYLLAITCLWLVIELLWLAVPSKSYNLVQTKKRHAYLVQRYAFGEDKEGTNETRMKGRESDKRRNKSGNEEEIEKLVDLLRATNDQTQTNSDVVLQNVQERVELLQRLNVAMRRKNEPPSDSPSLRPDLSDPTSLLSAHSKMVVHTEGRQETAVPSSSESVPAVKLGYSSLALDLAVPDIANDSKPSSPSISEHPSKAPPSRRSQSSSSSSSDHMVVGYYRRVVPPKVSGSPGAGEQPTLSAATAPLALGKSTAAMIMGRRKQETPLDSSPRRNSSRSQSSSPPPFKRLSKLFTRATPPQLHDLAPRSSEDVALSAAATVPDPSIRPQRSSSNSDARENADDSHPLLLQPPRNAPGTESPVGFQAVDLEGLNAIAEATRRQRFEFGGDPDWRGTATPQPSVTELSTQQHWRLRREGRGSVAAATLGANVELIEQPAARHSATTLSGLEAVREAASRQQFDFTSDDESPWL